MFNPKTSKLVKIICLLTMLVLVLPSLALAGGEENWEDYRLVNGQAGNIVLVEAGQTVKGPALYTGNYVTIGGTIDGTAVAAGQEVTVDGTINGDLFVFARKVVLKGKVLGNLYTAAGEVQVSGEVSRDAVGVGRRVNVTKEALINRDMYLAAERVFHAGQVGRQMFAHGTTIMVNGRVQDDTKLAAERVLIQDGAVLGGNLFYVSSNQADVSANASISGRTDWKKVAPHEPRATDNVAGSVFANLLGILGALLLWFVVATWRPQFWAETSRPLLQQPLKTLGYGALVLLLTPLLAILLMITVIGLPLGIILGLAYGVCLYLSKIIAAVIIGYALAQRFGWPEVHKGVWLVLLGLALLAVLTKLPVLGFFVTLAVIFTGLGSIFLVYSKPAAQNEI